MRYYFISYVWNSCYGSSTFKNTVTTTNPIQFLQEIAGWDAGNHVLISWQEITKEQYDNFKKIDFKRNLQKEKEKIIQKTKPSKKWYKIF